MSAPYDSLCLLTHEQDRGRTAIALSRLCFAISSMSDRSNFPHAWREAHDVHIPVGIDKGLRRAPNQPEAL